MAEFKDYYKTLGVPRDADAKAIRSAFRKLAAKHHPDKNPGDAGAEERFKDVNEAYTALSDPEKRSLYDRFGHTGNVPPPGAAQGANYRTVSPEDMEGFSDFFRSLFGGGVGGGAAGYTSRGFSVGGSAFGDAFEQRGRVPQGPRIVQAELVLPLEQAFHGGETTIQVESRPLEVSLPEGVRDGTKLRLRGQAPGGGDLILIVKVEKHPVFTLSGDQVRVRVDVPDYRAVLGGTVRVPTLGGDVEMTLPPGTQAGRVLRLRGQGWPRKGGGRGDELAEIRLIVPTEPSADQRKLYQQLAAAAGEPVASTGEAKTRSGSKGHAGKANPGS